MDEAVTTVSEAVTASETTTAIVDSVVDTEKEASETEATTETIINSGTVEVDPERSYISFIEYIKDYNQTALVNEGIIYHLSAISNDTLAQNTLIEEQNALIKEQNTQLAEIYTVSVYIFVLLLIYGIGKLLSGLFIT